MNIFHNFPIEDNFKIENLDKVWTIMQDAYPEFVATSNAISRFVSSIQLPLRIDLVPNLAIVVHETKQRDRLSDLGSDLG